MDGFWFGDIARSRQNTLYSFCLVSHRWNKIFTPILYEYITLDDLNAISTVPTLLLRRTLWHDDPSKKTLVKRVRIYCSKKNTSAVCMVVMSNLPNLRELVVHQFDQTVFHPNLAQHLRLLSKTCTVWINAASVTKISPESIPLWLRFLRTSQPTSCVLMVEFKEPASQGE